MTVDRLTAFISSELMHEMIHLGDSNQFPLMLSPTVEEQYRYKGCRNIVGTEMKWKNCDTFALIAQAIYMNAYYTDGDKLKKLPDNLIPPSEQRNIPLKKSIQ
ncbi:hypothetical protein N7509_013213 [Penicillium cosmopolitanum]|uniref:Uncharacterized protein n=1 Tax=Penicillium cosmopolitanum TaxID=1131564 RepID=A0A9W9SCV1_9EURO|nr:uncharacterized protein N7509_013213 [Penicillium cosmopolitanum]KAJ5376327.1 hypothetical protein N7509_013213 [Penicillium cosmopolitanum]